MSDKIIYSHHYATGEPVQININRGNIESISVCNETRVQKDSYVAPGLIDIQVNGYCNVDFASLKLSVNDVIETTRRLWRSGVTTYMPTIISSSPQVYQQVLTVLREAIHVPELRGSISGIHLEGPYLSGLEGYRGAHDAQWLKPPDWNEFQKLNLLSGNQVQLVTMAPELSGAPDFMNKCSENGIIIAIGHHAGTHDQITMAVKSGAVLSTHLGNACANLISRHNNVLWPQLANDDLYASLIADGFHLNRDEIIVFFRSKGPDKIILISDITKFAGLPPGDYDWNDTKLNVSPEGKIYLPQQDLLAGAGKTLIEGVNTFSMFTGCHASMAIDCASANPARLMQMNDRGDLSPGKRADLIIFSEDNGIKIHKTLVAGETVFEI